MRQRWGQRMFDVLHPAGLLICLEFPLYKDPTIRGPPWGVSEDVYRDVLACGGSGVVHESASQECQGRTSLDQKGHFNRVLRIKPERSHVAGKGTDMLSVWIRK